MNTDDFLQDHAKWKYGRKKEHKPEDPTTWLMTDSGYYFQLEGDLESELQRMRGLDMPCTVHENQTSTTMCGIQTEKRIANG